MGQTITQKILARASGNESVRPGEIVWANVDLVMMHDVTSIGAINLLRREFGNKIAEGLEVVVTPDHYVPGMNVAAANQYNVLKRFVLEHEDNFDLTAYMLEGNGDYGVCHVMLPHKGHVKPGMVIIGGDSHTCTYGALGAFSTGVGSTEVGNTLATGDLWFRVPETYRFNVEGRMPRNVMAKDLFLHVVGEIGVDGALNMAMEWGGDTIRNMKMDERMTLTNMAIEAGAKSGIIEPDDRTMNYLLSRNAIRQGEGFDMARYANGLRSDQDSVYANNMDIDVSGLEPLVARPHLPSNVAPARELSDVRIDQAYIGSCTGGKWEDFVAAAEVLEGNKVADHVRLMIVPTTREMQGKMITEGLYDIFYDAGGLIGPPTCGACLGGYYGVLGDGDVCVSTTNRNFRKRMGSDKSEVYLASPRTVAASAITGHITGAEK